MQSPVGTVRAVAREKHTESGQLSRTLSSISYLSSL